MDKIIEAVRSVEGKPWPRLKSKRAWALRMLFHPEEFHTDVYYGLMWKEYRVWTR